MEKLLLFHLSDTDCQKISQIAARLKFRYECVDVSRYSQSLGALADGRQRTAGSANGSFVPGSSPAAPLANPVPADSLLLFCGFSDKRMDRLLFALRQADVSVDFKAVLTPANRTWNVPKLLLEMHREKAAFPGK